MGEAMIKKEHCNCTVQAVRELIFWDNYNFDNEALWAVPLERFHGLALLDSDQHRRKYLWDFFLPHYSCPHKEKVGVMAVRDHPSLPQLASTLCS